MSFPAHTQLAKPANFEQRLALVKAEIASRVQKAPKDQQRALTGRLWVNWMIKNLLNDQEVSA